MAGKPPPTRAARPVILELAGSDRPLLEQAAVLLAEHFEPPQPWPSLESAREEVDRHQESGLLLAAVVVSGVVRGLGGRALADWRMWVVLARGTVGRQALLGEGSALV
jgi:hypothetical protein